jgi:hypothetical protein
METECPDPELFQNHDFFFLIGHLGSQVSHLYRTFHFFVGKNDKTDTFQELCGILCILIQWECETPTFDEKEQNLSPFCGFTAADVNKLEFVSAVDACMNMKLNHGSIVVEKKYEEVPQSNLPSRDYG